VCILVSLPLWLAVRSRWGEPTGEEPTGQDTSRGLVRKWHKAIVDGDEARYMECFGDLDSGARATVEMEFAYYQLWRAYRTDVMKTYGSSGWVWARLASVVPMPSFDPDWPETARITCNGDGKADVLVTTNMPKPGQFTSGGYEKMVRTGGIWYFRGPGDSAGWRQFLQGATERLRTVGALVGEPGVTPRGLAEKDHALRGVEFLGLLIRAPASGPSPEMAEAFLRLKATRTGATSRDCRSH